MTWSTSIIDAPNIQTITTEAITRYVATTGSDANPGTEAAPFLTIQAALNSLPRVLKHPVTINIGAGNFAGAHISGFTTTQPASTSVGSYLSLVGTLANVTPATGAATGTVTSGTTGGSTAFGTITITDAGWTSDDFKGKILVITSGANSGAYFVIRTNTADTITICGTFTSGSLAGSTFSIQESTTVITSHVVVPPSAFSTVGTTKYGFVILGNTLTNYNNTTNCDLVVSNIKVSITGGGRGFIAYGPGNVGFRRCHIVSNSVICAGFNYLVDTCYLYSGSTSQIGLSGGGGGLLGISKCLIVGSRTAVYGADTAELTVTSTAIESFNRAGIVFGPSSAGQAVQSTYIDGASAATTYGIYASNSSAFTNNCAIAGLAFSKVVINNCNYGIFVEGSGNSVAGQQVFGSGNTIAVNLAKGAQCQIDSSSTLTGTTEISIDGVTTDFTTMRAASPKVIRDANYGTMIYE